VWKTAFWGGKKGSILHFNKTTPLKLHHSKGFEFLWYPIQASLMEPQKPRFFMAHEKGSFGHEAKKEHSRGAHLGCKQGGLKWRVLILGGEDVVVDCQKWWIPPEEKGTQFQAKNNFSQPVDMEGGLNDLWMCGRSNCIALDRFQQYSRISLHKNFSATLFWGPKIQQNLLFWITDHHNQAAIFLSDSTTATTEISANLNFDCPSTIPLLF